MDGDTSAHSELDSAGLTLVDHVGIAVQHTDDAVQLYDGALGMPAGPKRLLPREGIYITFIGSATAKIEILEPAGTDSAVSRFLAKRGEGIHHICFRVEDVTAMANRLTAAGCEVIDRQPRIGLDGEKLVFIHPKSAHGVLIELLQPSDDD